MPVHELYKDGQLVARTELPASAEEIKMEAQRRILALCGVATLEAAIIKQINSTDPTLKAGIDAIRAASNAIEQSPPIEVCTDPRWPA